MSETDTFPRLVVPGQPVAEVEAGLHPEISEEILPSAPDVANIFLGGLFTLGVLAACYVAATVVLPIVVAFVLMLVLQPAMRLSQRFCFPRGIAAAAVIVVFFGAAAGAVTVLSGPAADWAQKLPEGIPKLQERLSFLAKPISAFENVAHRAENLTNLSGQSSPLPVTVAGAGFFDRLLDGTRSLMSGLLETVLVLFFLLIAGDTFLRRLVEVLPRFKNKRQAVEISQQIESDISAYLITITLMNAAVGFLTGLVAWLCGLGDPLLWGGVAFLLNYVPILGPMIGVTIFLLAGLLSIDALWLAFAPAALYLGIHIAEGETVTPLLLARRFTINPVLVIMALVFWYWMWGVPGAILATPMLAVTKIICDRIDALKPVGHFIEG
ncbi:MAG TPA: AI-2E family transporter, partial [Xanthobacteraceae bacterium]|jgi:predicted PurR-regulated permease PerM